MVTVSLKDQLLSDYKKRTEAYQKRHDAVKERMEKRKQTAADMKQKYDDRTSSLTRLRNK